MMNGGSTQAAVQENGGQNDDNKLPVKSWLYEFSTLQ